MPIYYYGLRKLMDDNNITQKALAEACDIAPNSISRMMQGEYVSIETIDKICNFFNCDYGNIITRFKKDDPIGYVSDAQYEEGMAQVRTALVYYMEKTGEAVSRVSQKTTLSVNTIKSFLLGNPIHSTSFLKLTKLGDVFNNRLAEIMNGAMKPDEYIAPKPIKKVSFKVYYKLLKLVPNGKLARREDIEAYVAKKLNVEYVSFALFKGDSQWEFSTDIMFTIPYWREISTRGVLQETSKCSKETQEQALIEEGHTLVKYGRDSKRVEDFQNKLFDFNSIDDKSFFEIYDDEESKRFYEF